MAIDLNRLNAADAALVRDCEAEAADARNLTGFSITSAESLCSLGRGGRDYTPYSDDVESNVLFRLFTSAFNANWGDYDRAKAAYESRVGEIFGAVSQHALDYFEDEWPMVPFFRSIRGFWLEPEETVTA